MARTKKRAYKKPVKGKVKEKEKEKHTVVDDNEQAFLNFVDQNARRNIGFSSESSSDAGFAAFDSGSDSDSSSSSSSLSGRGISSGSSDDEPAIDKGMQKSAKMRGRPSKRGKVSKMVKTVKQNPMKGVSRSLSRKGKELEKPCQDPRYNKKELRASFKVIKKLMELDEAASFSAPVDPVSQGIPDYLDVVDTPMDFGTICTNLRNGVKYLNAEGVYKDVLYIWENCLKYNKKGDYIVYLMKRVKKKFMKYWRAADLQSEMPRKTSGYSYSMLCSDHAMRHSRFDAIYMANHMTGNFNQMPQEYCGVIHPQSQVPLSSYNHPCEPEPSTARIPQFSQLHARIEAGYSHLCPSNHHASKHSKHDAISTMNHTLDRQLQQDNYVAMKPQSHILFSSYSQPYQLHQHQPSFVQPPQVSQLQARPNVNYLGCQMQQDNFGTILSQSQVLPPGHCQNCHTHKPRLSNNLPPQLSQFQAGTYNNYTAHSHLPSPTARTVKRKKHATRDAVASMMSGPTHTNQQQPQMSSRNLHRSQQSTYRPQMSQPHFGAHIDEAGHLQKLPSMDGSMGHNGSVPRSPVNCMGVNQTELQPEQLPLSDSESDESHQPQASTGQPQPFQPLANMDFSSPGHRHKLPSMVGVMGHNGSVPRCKVNCMVVNQTEPQFKQLPLSDSESDESDQPQSITGQPQPSQPLANMDISSSEHSCVPIVNASKKGGRHGQRVPAGLGSEIPLGSGHFLPQTPSESHSEPDLSKQPIQKTQKKARGRPPSKGCDIRDKPDAARVVVSSNNLGQPVGPEAYKLGTFMGTIVRNGEVAPLTFKDWKTMPDANKEAMWQLIQTKFDVDILCKNWAMKSLAHKWRNWKAKLKAEHYYPHKTDEERLKDRDERIIPEQWPILVSYWNSEEMKLRCSQNKANRAKYKGSRTTGSKSYARIREEEREKRSDGKEPSRAELYIRTRTRKDGQPVDEAAAEIISKLREEVQKQQNLHGSSDWEDAFLKVMGEEKGGHVRMYGLGPTPTDIWGQKLGCIELMKIALETKRSANEEVNKLLDKLGSMEQKYASMEAQMARVTSNMQNIYNDTGEPSKASGIKQVPNNSNSPEDSVQAQAHSLSSSHAAPSNEVDESEGEA